MFKKKYLTALALLVGCTVFSQNNDSFTVYFFLLEDCKITQAYADRVAEIYNQYAGDSIGFVALFPNPISSDTSVAAFREKYQIPFPCSIDKATRYADSLGITITPEVAVINQNTQELLYRGRIDNMYERVGERRRVVTSFELEEALQAIRNHKEVPIARTQATGCFLPKRQH